MIKVNKNIVLILKKTNTAIYSDLYVTPIYSIVNCVYSAQL